MVVFGSCLWLCWKYRECTDDRDRDHPLHPRMPQQPNQPNFEMRSSSGTSNESHGGGGGGVGFGRPTAPPLSHAPSMEKEDMPPAYDELFPVR